MGVVRDLPSSIRKTAVLDADNEANYNYSSTPSTIQRLTFTAGETIVAKELLAIGTDGKVYKASALASNNKPVFGIAYNGGASGSSIELYNDNETIEYGSTFEVGKTIFLSSAGVPTTTYSYVDGNLFQRLGIAISSNSFVIKIEESAEMG
jgi:hypothetical protein